MLSRADEETELIARKEKHNLFAEKQDESHGGSELVVWKKIAEVKLKEFERFNRIASRIDRKSF